MPECRNEVLDGTIGHILKTAALYIVKPMFCRGYEGVLFDGLKTFTLLNHSQPLPQNLAGILIATGFHQLLNYIFVMLR